MMLAEARLHLAIRKATSPGPGFTGVITDRLNRKRRYVNGHPVALDAPGASQPGGTGESSSKPQPKPKQDQPGTTPQHGQHTSDPQRQKTYQALAQQPKHAKPLNSGVNATSIVTMPDGTMGVWKPAEGERGGLRVNIQGGTYFRREAAASSVADILGFSDLVPATITHSINGQEGSVQHFAKDVTPAKGVKNRYDGPEDLARAAVFDYLIGQTDRHDANWMLTNKKAEGLAGKLKQWTGMEQPEGEKLVLIDHGLAFPASEPRATSFDSDLLRKASKSGAKVPDLSDWSNKWPQVEQALKHHGIEGEAIAVVKKRFDSLVAGAGKPIAELPSMMQHPDMKTMADMLAAVPQSFYRTSPENMPKIRRSISKASRGPRVEFFTLDNQGDDVPLGSVSWDGSSLVCEPAESPFLQEVVAEGGDQGEAYLKRLPERYKSAYLRAKIVGEKMRKSMPERRLFGVLKSIVSPSQPEVDNGHELARFYVGMLNEIGKPSQGLLDGIKDDLASQGITVVFSPEKKRWVAKLIHAKSFYKAGFTGIKTDKLGRKYRYVNGRRVAMNEAKHTEAKQKRAARGPVNAQQLQQKLQPYARVKLRKEEVTSAKHALNALISHHGEMVVHRIEELADELTQAMGQTEHKQHIAKRLSQLNMMLDFASKKGYTGDVGELPPATQGDGHGKEKFGIAVGDPPAQEQPNGGVVGGINSGDDRIRLARPEHTPEGDPGLVPERLRGHLNGHQVKGVALALAAMGEESGPRGFLLADGTGVGKTRQQVAIASTFAEKGKPVLIVSMSEVMKPDWANGTVSDAWSADPSAMGVQTKLVKGGQLDPGQIHLTTYDQLSNLVDHVTPDTVVIFDEAHNLKNAGTIQATMGKRIIDQAGAVCYATATPADDPDDLGYLSRTGLNIDRKTFTKLPSHEKLRTISNHFDELTKAGKMVKREIAMDQVPVHFERVPLPDHAHESLRSVASKYGQAKRGASLMEQRRHQEQFKVPHVVDQIKKEIAAGRRPIVFFSNVNDSESGNTPSTLNLLKKHLTEAGITDHAELHSGAKIAKQGMADFQSGKAKVALATVESGGTGIQLDDVGGDAPRTLILMTPQFSANQMMQVFGRVWRLKTKSIPKIVNVFADTEVDRWNSELQSGKVKNLGAIVHGAAKDLDFPSSSEVKSMTPQRRLFSVLKAIRFDWFAKAREKKPDGVYTDIRGRKYRLLNGKRAPVNAAPEPAAQKPGASTEATGQKPEAKPESPQGAAKVEQPKPAAKKPRVPKKPTPKEAAPQGVESPPKIDWQKKQKTAIEALRAFAAENPNFYMPVADLKEALGDVTPGEMEDLLRELSDQGQIRAHPFTRPAYTIKPEAEPFMFMAGQEPKGYIQYVGDGKANFTSPVPLKPSSLPQRTPEQKRAWHGEIADIAQKYQQSHPGKFVPMPVLFAAAKKQGATLGEFHDGLREMAANGELKLHPWTAPMYQIENEETGLVQNQETKFFAEATGKKPAIASDKPASTATQQTPQQESGPLAGLRGQSRDAQVQKLLQVADKASVKQLYDHAAAAGVQLPEGLKTKQKVIQAIRDGMEKEPVFSAKPTEPKVASAPKQPKPPTPKQQSAADKKAHTAATREHGAAVKAHAAAQKKHAAATTKHAKANADLAKAKEAAANAKTPRQKMAAAKKLEAAQSKVHEARLHAALPAAHVADARRAMEAAGARHDAAAAKAKFSGKDKLGRTWVNGELQAGAKEPSATATGRPAVDPPASKPAAQQKPAATKPKLSKEQARSFLQDAHSLGDRHGDKLVPLSAMWDRAKQHMSLNEFHDHLKQLRKDGHIDLQMANNSANVDQASAIKQGDDTLAYAYWKKPVPEADMPKEDPDYEIENLTDVVREWWPDIKNEAEIRRRAEDLFAQGTRVRGRA